MSAADFLNNVLNTLVTGDGWTVPTIITKLITSSLHIYNTHQIIIISDSSLVLICDLPQPILMRRSCTLDYFDRKYHCGFRNVCSLFEE